MSYLKNQYIHCKKGGISIRQKIKEFAVLLSILLLFPCVTGLLSGKNPEIQDFGVLESVEKEEAEYFVEYKGTLFTQHIPLEDFLIGEIACAIPIDSDMEAVKAQAVLLRTNFFAKLLESQKQGSISGQDTDVTMQSVDVTDADSYLSVARMQKLWKEDFEKYYEKCKQAVMETKGIILVYKEEPVEVSYHSMSSGKTRNGSEIFSDGRYEYLTQTECEKNVENKRFLQNKKISKKDLNQLVIQKRDSSGYVLSVSCNGIEMSGEQFRNTYHLASANFTMEERENNFLIETKGVGHGLGMDQTYANYLAGQGKDYIQILKYFFKKLTISKR